MYESDSSVDIASVGFRVSGSPIYASVSTGFFFLANSQAMPMLMM